MTTRTARCACGKLSVACTGEPVRISMCHCLDCQKRTGSTYGAQARFPKENVAVSGVSKIFRRTGDSGGKIETHFCPECGSTVFWTIDALPGFVAVAVGAFADPAFPAPRVSVYGNRKHAWVSIPAGAELM